MSTFTARPPAFRTGSGGLPRGPGGLRRRSGPFDARPDVFGVRSAVRHGLRPQLDRRRGPHGCDRRCRGRGWWPRGPRV